MSILIRKIKRAKWQEIVDKDNKLDTSADAITNCLKTFNNDLSVWKIDSMSDLNSAILCLITGSQQSSLSKIDYIFFDEETLIKNGLILNETPGDTVIDSLKNLHRDISQLTYSKLGIIKTLIIEFLEKNDDHFFSRADLKKLLKSAIDEGIVKIEDLNKELIKNEKLNI